MSAWRLLWELERRWGKGYVRKWCCAVPIFMFGVLLFCYTTVAFSLAGCPAAKQLTSLCWDEFWNGYFCLLLRYWENLKKIASSQDLIFFFNSSVKLNFMVEYVVYQQKSVSPWLTVWSHSQFTQLSSVFYESAQPLRWAGVLKLPSHQLTVCNAVSWGSIKVLDIFFYNAGISEYVEFSGWAELEGLKSLLCY